MEPAGLLLLPFHLGNSSVFYFLILLLIIIRNGTQLLSLPRRWFGHRSIFIVVIRTTWWRIDYRLARWRGCVAVAITSFLV